MKEELIAMRQPAQARHLRYMQLVANMIANPEKYPRRSIHQEIRWMNYHAHLIESITRRIAEC